MELDHFSYRCGVIDCFNEMVRAGLKPMALAHPCPTPAERDSYLPFCEEICGKYGTKFFPEDAMLLTDLFPLSANRRTYNIIFYRDEAVRRTYEDLKAEKAGPAGRRTVPWGTPPPSGLPVWGPAGLPGDGLPADDRGEHRPGSRRRELTESERRTGELVRLSAAAAPRQL